MGVIQLIVYAELAEENLSLNPAEYIIEEERRIITMTRHPKKI